MGEGEAEGREGEEVGREGEEVGREGEEGGREEEEVGREGFVGVPREGGGEGECEKEEESFCGKGIGEGEGEMDLRGLEGEEEKLCVLLWASGKSRSASKWETRELAFWARMEEEGWGEEERGCRG